MAGAGRLRFCHAGCSISSGGLVNHYDLAFLVLGGEGVCRGGLRSLGALSVVLPGNLRGDRSVLRDTLGAPGSK